MMVFSGRKSRVQVRMRTHSAHAVHTHCACHRLQLASLQAANSVPEINEVFGLMGNIVLLFAKENASPEGGTSYLWIARIESGKT